MTVSSVYLVILVDNKFIPIYVHTHIQLSKNTLIGRLTHSTNTKMGLGAGLPSHLGAIN